MTSRSRSALVVLLVAAATACSEPTRSLTAVVTDGRPLTFFPPGPFPALSKPGTIYVETTPLSDPKSWMPVVTRYVLYDDGTHGRQSMTAGKMFEYTGRWTRSDSTIAFEWNAWSAAGPWGATGTLRGELLDVRYNMVMYMTDFIDAVYVLAPDAR